MGPRYIRKMRENHASSRMSVQRRILALCAAYAALAAVLVITAAMADLAVRHGLKSAAGTSGRVLWDVANIGVGGLADLVRLAL
jgi:hypothetical protein